MYIWHAQSPHAATFHSASLRTWQSFPFFVFHFDGENRFHAGYFLPRCLIDDAESFAHAETDVVGRYLYFITWEEFPPVLPTTLSLFPSFEITPGIEELISHRARVDSLAKIHIGFPLPYCERLT